MRITATVSIGVQQILAERGLGPSHEAELFLGSEVKRLCDPYVPMQQGDLKNNAAVVSSGSSVELIYNQPYSHYQYHGIVMAGRAPKHYTGQAIQHHGGPMRGKEWDKRMMADQKDELVKSFANYVGGESK